MKTTEEILTEKIIEWNKIHNDVQKFQFNKEEMQFFTDIINSYVLDHPTVKEVRGSDLKGGQTVWTGEWNTIKSVSPNTFDRISLEFTDGCMTTIGRTLYFLVKIELTK